MAGRRREALRERRADALHLGLERLIAGHLAPFCQPVSPMKVKFCGITRIEDAREAVRLGAWARSGSTTV